MSRITLPAACVLALLSVPLSAQAASDGPQPGPVRLSGGFAAGQILQKVPPVYPAEARQAGIQGTVILHAIIGKEGHVEDLQVISGPEQLQAAALDAVRQWVYRPYLLNGEPTEVDTTVTVNYSLAAPIEDSSAATAASAQADSIPGRPHRIRISGAVSQGLLLDKVSPTYPPEARQQGVEGTVILHAVIDATGHIQTLDPVSGPPVLQAAALDAVHQWTYRPYRLNGEPISVDTIVKVDFHLSH